MPVEIFELNVKANVKENADCGPSVGNAAAGGSATGSAAATGNQAIIQECVTQVLEILRRNQER